MRSLRRSSVLFCTLAMLLAGCGGSEEAPPADNGKTAANGSSDSASTATDSGETDANGTPVVVADPIDEPETVPAQPDAESEYAESDVELEPLTIGSPAPPLQLASWVMGDAVEGFEAGQVYVVEFWATWCGPCKTSMPHLSKLQEEYGDKVTMIGISDEPSALVNQFLDEEQSPGNTWRETIKYAIATDDGRATNAAYMEAAGQGGIPTAFVVGQDGVIEWIGHPMEMDEPLAQVTAGEWDRAQAIAEMEFKQQIEESMAAVNAAARAQEWDEALKIIDGLVENPAVSPGMLTRLSGFKVSLLQAAGRTDEALTLLDELLAGSEPSLQLSMLKLSILQSEDRTEEAAQLETEIVDQNFDHPQLLNQIAWSISEREEPRDLALAMKAATRASELTGDQDPSVLDTLARVHYEHGNLDEAIAWQKKAVAVGADFAELADRLESYEAEKAAQEGAESREPVEAPRGAPEDE